MESARLLCHQNSKCLSSRTPSWRCTPRCRGCQCRKSRCAIPPTAGRHRRDGHTSMCCPRRSTQSSGPFQSRLHSCTYPSILHQSAAAEQRQDSPLSCPFFPGVHRWCKVRTNRPAAGSLPQTTTPDSCHQRHREPEWQESKPLFPSHRRHTRPSHWRSCWR